MEDPEGYNKVMESIYGSFDDMFIPPQKEKFFHPPPDDGIAVLKVILNECQMKHLNNFIGHQYSYNNSSLPFYTQPTSSVEGYWNIFEPYHPGSAMPRNDVGYVQALELPQVIELTFYRYEWGNMDELSKFAHTVVTDMARNGFKFIQQDIGTPNVSNSLVSEESLISILRWRFSSPPNTNIPCSKKQREQWYIYYYVCNHYEIGIKFTHKDLAEALGFVEGTARNYYNTWKVGFDPDQLIAELIT